MTIDYLCNAFTPDRVATWKEATAGLALKIRDDEFAEPEVMVGRMDDLADDIQDELRAAMDRTANDSGMLFNIALNYGGRAEIVDAARRAIEAGIRPEELDEQRFASFLYTAGQPDPDLLIRTSGEMRVSNYLLWQIAYTEIYVTETLWPDFRRRHLLEAVLAYQKRERRYGGIGIDPRLRSGQARA